MIQPDGANLQTLNNHLLNAGDIAVYRSLVVAEVTRLVGEAAGRPMRILEVGGGTGHLTWPLAQALRGSQNVEYRFTDLGRSFVVTAQRKAAECGLDFMTFGVLDVNQGPATQDSNIYRDFNVILAFNVLHVTPDLRRTLSNLRNFLAPGGLLYILEANSLPRIGMMITGLLEGWWSFDDDLREQSPLLAPHRWQQLLDSLGFGPTVALPPRDHQATADHGLIVGMRPLPPEIDTAMARTGELRSLGATVTVIADSELSDHLHLTDAAEAFPARATSNDASSPSQFSDSFNRRPDLTTPYVAPTTELENLVARHWADALGLDRVGIHDNFFDLGGESLLMIQMAGRLRDQFSVELSVKKLFENLTVTELVREIEHLQHAPVASTTKITASRRRTARR